MRAVKDNKEYTVVSDEQRKAYTAIGYDIYDNDGKLLERGAGKTVSAAEYDALKAELEALRKEKAEPEELRNAPKAEAAGDKAKGGA